VRRDTLLALDNVGDTSLTRRVEASSSGEVTKWPLAEISLTPTLAYPGRTVAMDELSKHYKAAGLPPFRAVLSSEGATWVLLVGFVLLLTVRVSKPATEAKVPAAPQPASSS
jgi:hypothetical protein